MTADSRRSFTDPQPEVIRLADEETLRRVLGVGAQTLRLWARKDGFPVRTRAKGTASRPFIVVAEALEWLERNSWKV